MAERSKKPAPVVLWIPEPGNVVEHKPIWEDWQTWGVVSAVQGNCFWCHGRSASYWAFGKDACLGNNAAFRIVQSAPEITMEDPFF